MAKWCLNTAPQRKGIPASCLAGLAFVAHHSPRFNGGVVDSLPHYSHVHRLWWMHKAILVSTPSPFHFSQVVHGGKRDVEAIDSCAL
jgi:hypothetical protein